MATIASYLAAPATAHHVRPPGSLEILTCGHPPDGPPTGGLRALGHEHPEEDDALALLAGDLGPVVGVGGVREILVLLVLLADRLQEVVGADAGSFAGDLPL